MIDLLDRHHLPHIRTTGRIADHTGAAANQCDRLVASHLQPLHKNKRHEMTDMQRIRRRIEADIEGCLTVVNKLADFLLIRHLRDQTALHQFLINSHRFLLALFYNAYIRHALPNAAI